MRKCRDLPFIVGLFIVLLGVACTRSEYPSPTVPVTDKGRGLETVTAPEEEPTLFFGPARFTRLKGPPGTTIVSEFTTDLEHFRGPFTLYLRNGEEDGKHRVTLARVTLDGQDIFGWWDFLQRPIELQAEVTIVEDSELGVFLSSAVGGFVTIWIDGFLLPGRVKIGSEGGTAESADGGASLDLPQNAVDETTVFHIEPYSGPVDPQTVAGTAYELGPDGIEFDPPALLKLAFDPLKVSHPENLEIRTLVSDEWVPVETSELVDGQHAISTTVSHLSAFLVADTEFDSVDLALLETLQWIAEQEQMFSLWSEPTNGREYKVSDTPIYFIRRDENDVAIRAYLVNFPSPPAGAVAINHAFPGAGVVHRYDDQMNELFTTFDFDFDLSGRPTFAIAYKPHDMDREPLSNTPIPYSSHDVWVGLFVHELFHHYQFHAPDSDWISLAWGGLSRADYPVTADNIALSLLERHALMAGRDAATVAEKSEVLRRVLGIRHARVQLPEAVREKCQISAVSKTHGQVSTSPDGVGQSFTACQSGMIRSIQLDVIAVDNSNVRIELQEGTDSWPGSYSQDLVLIPGENLVQLDVPFLVEDGVVYSFGLFPSTGDLRLWSGGDTYAGGEAFFIEGSSKLGITPSPDLVFELTVEGPNYIDRMDRYQERNEGSTTQVVHRLFVLSGNTVYAQELMEHLDRGTWTHYQTSRDMFMSTTFQGGWYDTGATILGLVDEVTSMDWRSTFPAGGNPIEVLETLYGPLTQPEIDQLVAEAKQAYDWLAIVDQVSAIPDEYLDPSP